MVGIADENGVYLADAHALFVRPGRGWEGFGDIAELPFQVETIKNG
jgi:hypothetical protein